MSRTLCTLVALMLLGLASPAVAEGGGCRGGFCDSSRSFFPSARPGRGGGDQDRARDASRAGQVLPLDAILRRVQARYPGRLLDASLVRGGGGYIYLIKLIDRTNRVRILQVDAETGRVLGGG